jgi:uncharacterized UBP type Zn finger protein
MLATMTQEDLLSTLRSLPEEKRLNRVDQIITQQLLENNHLEDIKLKQAITNELLLEILEVLREKASSDFASQARPIKNKPFPSPIRRRYGNNS